MGFLDRLLRRPTATLGPPNTPETWLQGRDWLTAWPAPRNLVAGEERRQRELRQLAGCEGRCLRAVNVTLSPEPTNEYDPDAVAAFVGGMQVGYLRREIAGALADACAEHGRRVPTFVVAGVLRGGSDDDVRIGAHVWLDRRVSPGPSIVLEDDGHVVSWPPFARELAVASF